MINLAMASLLPKLVTRLPGPKAQALVERDAQFISPSYTRTYPLVVASGQGAIVEDVDGNRFLDCSAGIAVVATGHCHPQVVEAIQRQAARLIHMSGTDFYYENMVDLAQKLASLTPGGVPRKVYFGNSGTEAIEAAIKLARYHTDRKQFVAFFGAFHGRTMGSLALTGSKNTQKKNFFPLMPGVHHVPYADCYRCPYGKKVATCAVECAKAIEDPLFRTILPPEEVAAIVVEPIQGEGGYLVPPKKFLDELRRIADQHGILLFSTKSSAAWDGPVRCSRANTLTRCRISSRWPRESPVACRSAPPSHAPRSWTGSRAPMRQRSAGIRWRWRRRSRPLNYCTAVRLSHFDPWVSRVCSVG